MSDLAARRAQRLQGSSAAVRLAKIAGNTVDDVSVLGGGGGGGNSTTSNVTAGRSLPYATSTPTGGVGVSLTSASSPQRKSHFSGSPVFSSSPPPGFGSTMARSAPKSTSATSEPADIRVGSSVKSSSPGGATSGTIGSRVGSGGSTPSSGGVGVAVSSRSKPWKVYKRGISIGLGVVMALGFALGGWEAPFFILCSFAVFGFLSVVWLLESGTQDSLRMIRTTLMGSNSKGTSEKLTVLAVLLLQQFGPLQELWRMGLDALCVSIVILVVVSGL